MPRFSAFNSTRFTSKPSYEEQIYREMVKALGSGENYSIDFDSLVAARLYANAMAFGRCKHEIERQGQQFRPTKALENLPSLEREYGLVRGRRASIAQRRADLVAAARLPRGASRNNVESVLRELFGSEFLAYVTTPTNEATVSPASPETVGVYDPPGSQRAVFELLQAVAVTGQPKAIQVRLLAGNQQVLRQGSRAAVDPGDYGRREAVTIDAVTQINGTTFTIKATFVRPHNKGTVLAMGRSANQYTSKRLNTFVMSDNAASAAKSRRRLHQAARQLLRSISTWEVIDRSGPFTVEGGRTEITTIGAPP